MCLPLSLSILLLFSSSHSLHNSPSFSRLSPPLLMITTKVQIYLEKECKKELRLSLSVCVSPYLYLSPSLFLPLFYPSLFPYILFSRLLFLFPFPSLPAPFFFCVSFSLHIPLSRPLSIHSLPPSLPSPSTLLIITKIQIYSLSSSFSLTFSLFLALSFRPFLFLCLVPFTYPFFSSSSSVHPLPTAI